MNTNTAQKVDGWMTPHELEWLAAEASKHKVIVEIGCFLGRSTRALGDNTSGVVYAIDNFVGPQDIQWSNVPTTKVDILRTFIANTCDLIAHDKVQMVVSDHAHAFVPETPDMVFIDGSHEYEDVKRDIELWWPRLKKGGLMCGHDFTNMAGVQAAVREKFGDVDINLANNTSIWYITKKVV